MCVCLVAVVVVVAVVVLVVVVVVVVVVVPVNGFNKTRWSSGRQFCFVCEVYLSDRTSLCL